MLPAVQTQPTIPAGGTGRRWDPRASRDEMCFELGRNGLMSAAISVIETTSRQSQLVSLSSAAIKQLGSTPVVEFWGYASTDVSRFASELAVRLSTESDVHLLRHWKKNPLAARVVAETKRDYWYEVSDIAAIRQLLPCAWNAALVAAELWDLWPDTPPGDLASGRDVDLLKSARWIICCGADGEVAQLIMLEPREIRETVRDVAVSLRLTLDEAR